MDDWLQRNKSSMTGLGSPPPIEALCVRLVDAAPRADTVFGARLEEQLVTALLRGSSDAPARVDRRLPLLASFLRTQITAYSGASVVAALLLLFTMATVSAVLAGVVLPHVAPREVAQHPPILAGFDVTDRPGQAVTLDELSTRAGFRVLLPTSLPVGCVNKGSFSFAEVSVIAINYSCVSLSEKKGGDIAAPPVAPGSLTEVSVNGTPALYVDGAWAQEPAAGATPPTGPKLDPAANFVWRRGLIQQLYFERDGVVVHLTADNSITRAEFIRIAESVR